MTDPQMPVDLADVIAGEAANALRSIATIIGCPANTDPLTDLDGLVLAVRGLAERAETVRVVTADRDALRAETDARIADAVAAERHAIGAWLRTSVHSAPFARSVEHGDHIDDDAPPLPSLRMVMLARDELLRQVKTLTAERDGLRAELDKRVAPHCQHAADPGHDLGHGVHPDRAGPSVMDAEIERLTAERDRRIDPVEHARAVLAAFKDGEDDVKAAYAMEQANGWEMTRATLLTRVGADVLAEVEDG